MLRRWYQASESGQVAVAVILAVAAVLVISVSLASRTTEEQAQTTQTTESTMTFNAAEAGVEQALSSVVTALENNANPPASGTVTLNNNTTVNYGITELSTLEATLTEGASAQVSLDSDRDGDGDYTGSVDILWGKDSDCTKNASLVITVIARPGGVARARHFAVGPNPTCPDRSGDQFTAASAGVSGYQYRYQVPVSAAAGSAEVVVRIKALYSDSPILVRGNPGALPTQQYLVKSTAVNTAGDKEETRVLEVRRSLPVAPAIMDYALYSGGSISK